MNHFNRLLALPLLLLLRPAFAAPDFLVDADWLSEHIDDENLVVLDVRLYNGGWSHWGNELTPPVVEGEEPYNEAFSL